MDEDTVEPDPAPSSVWVPYEKNKKKGAEINTKVHDDIVAHNLDGVLQNIYTDSFDQFSTEAYENRNGYAIRKNPATGETEMFVAGTRYTRDWVANGFEAVENATGVQIPTFYRGEYVKKIERAAKDNGVTVIYGHSRGGALVNQMEVPGAAVLELDGADGIDQQLPGPGHKSAHKPTWNLTQDQVFDKTIAQGGQDITTVTKEAQPLYIYTPDGKRHANQKYHRVSRDRPTYQYDYVNDKPIYTQGNRKYV